MKRIIAISILIIFCIGMPIVITKCHIPDRNIVGKWQAKDEYETTLIFNENGKGSMSRHYSTWQSDPFNYEIKKDTLIMYDDTHRTEQKFYKDGDILKIGDEFYIRQTD